MIGPLGSDQITANHLAESVQYRTLDRRFPIREAIFCPQPYGDENGRGSW
jgi:hypothetical protein